MKKLNSLMMLVLIGFIFLTASCDPKDDPKPAGKYENGILITNEGVFTQGNGSVSFYSFDEDTVANEIFKAENNRPLGDVVQSLVRADNKVLIAVNNSNKVEIVNGSDFKSLATVEIPKPRYIAVNNNKAYVSSSTGKIYIIDLSGNVLSDSIQAGSAPEGLIIADNKLYVANSGWGAGQTVSIFDLSDNSLITELNIDADNPTQFVLDNTGKVWVLASGQILYDQNWNIVGHTRSVLVRINPATDKADAYVPVFEERHPTRLGINKAGDKLYYGAGYGFEGIYAMSINANSAPTKPFIDQANYGFVIDRENDVIFLLQEAYTDNGKLIRYDAAGNKLGEYTVGIYPSNGGKRFPD